MSREETRARYLNNWSSDWDKKGENQTDVAGVTQNAVKRAGTYFFTGTSRL